MPQIIVGQRNLRTNQMIEIELDCTEEQALHVIAYAVATGCRVDEAFEVLYGTTDQKADLWNKAIGGLDS